MNQIGTGSTSFISQLASMGPQNNPYFDYAPHFDYAPQALQQPLLSQQSIKPKKDKQSMVKEIRDYAPHFDYAPQALQQPLLSQQSIKPKKDKQSMVKEIREDFSSFMRENKSVIYWALILYVVDHYCFEGALKGRLQNTIQNLVGKVEAKLDQAKI